ncbi:ribonuclease H-like domain-containing protein [Phycomyces blakesleeanus]|uniref:RNA exonuclease 4 n=2 Tax=Phycomyces blakesleeanus TaxID=4837 RepID=A0ABR3B9J9_PHYBL
MKAPIKKTSKPVPSSNWKKIQATIPPPQPVANRKPYIHRKRKGEALETTASSPEALKKTKKIKVEANVVAIPDKENLWFGDDLDEKDLQLAYGSSRQLKLDEKERKKAVVQSMDAVQGKGAQLGKFVAIDCEMVGVGRDGVDSALARVSIVNYNGAVLMDKYVQPQERVTDYRTHVSGIEPKHLGEGAITFKEAQAEVADIIKGRVLIGHAVNNDLKALMLDHPALFLRDTSRYKPFRKLASGRTPSLKTLVQKVLEFNIQSGSHSSVEDARFTMLLYRKVKDEWEKSFGSRAVSNQKKLAAKESNRTLKVTKETETIKQTVKEEPVSDSDDDSEDDSDSD